MIVRIEIFFPSTSPVLMLFYLLVSCVYPICVSDVKHFGKLFLNVQYKLVTLKSSHIKDYC